MIKLLKGVVQEFLLILAYLQDRGYTMQDVKRGVQDEWGGRMNPQNRAMTADAYSQVRNTLAQFDDGQVEEQSLQSLFETVLTTLRSKGKTPSDLVDAIVDVLKGPYARNVLSGQTLTMLRKVLLLPEESAGLVERLKKKEMSCAHCGHKFEGTEMACSYFEASGVVFFCYGCAFPTYIRCAKCQGSAIIPNKLRDGLNHARICEECKHPELKKEREKREEEERGGAIEEGALHFREDLEQLNRAIVDHLVEADAPAAAPRRRPDFIPARPRRYARLIEEARQDLQELAGAPQVQGIDPAPPPPQDLPRNPWVPAPGGGQVFVAPAPAPAPFWGAPPAWHIEPAPIVPDIEFPDFLVGDREIGREEED